MSESQEQMIAVLRETVVPVLRELRFPGSFPHFRCICETKIDLLTFQFNRHGGSFVVEIAVCGVDGFTTAWGEKIPAKKSFCSGPSPKQTTSFRFAHSRNNRSLVLLRTSSVRNLSRSYFEAVITYSFGSGKFLASSTD
jgi:hypothetical protein